MTDLTLSGSSYAGKAHADPVITAQAIPPPRFVKDNTVHKDARLTVPGKSPR